MTEKLNELIEQFKNHENTTLYSEADYVLDVYKEALVIFKLYEIKVKESYMDGYQDGEFESESGEHPRR